MARPRQFDRSLALDRATQTFWELGYEGASTAVLEERMSIGRSSLYAAFGSKDTLYAEAMERYIEGLRRRVIEPLRAEGPALQVLRSFFSAVARRGEPGEAPRRCCMVVRACLTGAGRSREVDSLVERAVAELDDAFHDLLRRARDEGAITHRGPLRGLARFLTTTFQGLNIAAGAGRSRRELHDIIRPALAALN